MSSTGNQGVPEWAGFFTPEEYNHFVEALTDYLSGHGVGFTIGEGSIDLEREDFCGSKFVGLLNLAQRCKQFELDSYADIVDEYFNVVRESMVFDKQFKEDSKDFEKVRQYVGVRIYDDAYMDWLGKDKAIGREIGPNLYAMLIFDLPNAVTNVGRESLEDWGKSEDELMAFGIQNIRDGYQFEMSEQDVDGDAIWHVSNDHYFSPNIVFDLENRPELLGRHGSLIGLPNRHSVLINPIEKGPLNGIIPLMIYNTARMCADGPGSLSSNLYWYKDGKFIDLPYEYTEQGLNFAPPEEFVDLMGSLETRKN